MEPIDFSQVKDIFLSVEGQWTITTLLGHMLRQIKSEYGERDHTYEIIGIEMFDGAQPDYWFPGDCGNVAIRITKGCVGDINEAAYQVAHEAVHLLNPKKFGKTTYLEEGLATYFAKHYLAYNAHIDMPINGDDYRIAYDLTSKLLSIDNTIIKTLRKIEPDISSFTPNMILSHCPKASPILVENLTTNFQHKIKPLL